MRETHRKILDLAQTQDLGHLTYRKIGEMLGGEHPYQVQYSIRQLIKSGLLLENRRTGSIYLGETKPNQEKLINIPILGNVSCGIATEIANNEEQGFVAVSPSLINGRSPNKLFALKAVGDSMDMASIGGNVVEEGDLVVVRQSEWIEARQGDYVVSLINEGANLKRFYLDKVNRRVILFSDSRQDYPPIVIAEEDMFDYKILGIASDVIKALPKKRLNKN